MQAADTMVRQHQLPSGLADRIRAYYAYVADSGALNMEAAVVAGLSPGLRQDMLLFMYRDLLLRVPFFARKSSTFILEVVQVRRGACLGGEGGYCECIRRCCRDARIGR